jgi:rhodanese-related sulfurtransferase
MRQFILGLSALLLTACQAQEKKVDSKHQLLSPIEFKAELEKSDDAYLIDVRTPQEYEAGTIEGAENLNIMDSTFEEGIVELDKNKTVFVFCARGGRSGKAANILKKEGFKQVIDLKGGFNNWQN